jgi:hypothetical protein
MSSVTEGSELKPIPPVMLEHLKLMFGRVAVEYPGGRVEIRCLRPDVGRPEARTFDASTGLKDAAEYAEDNNSNGRNVYFGINPRMSSVAPFGACSEEDVDAAFVSCADLDDKKSYSRYKESNNLKPSFVVVIFLTMMADFAELERNLILERTMAALHFKKNRGEVY